MDVEEEALIETVDGPPEGVKELPMYVPDGLSELGTLVFVRVGGVELVPGLHKGFPAESR